RVDGVGVAGARVGAGGVGRIGPGADVKAVDTVQGARTDHGHVGAIAADEAEQVAGVGPVVGDPDVGRAANEQARTAVDGGQVIGGPGEAEARLQRPAAVEVLGVREA